MSPQTQRLNDACKGMIAIDGPVASGKGTLGRRLAEVLDFAYLDTGSLYRATAAVALDQGCALHDADQLAALAMGLSDADLGRSDLRSEAVGNAASKIAALPAVRDALLAYQRHYAASPPGAKRGAILDGRDIGTVVLPNAQLKLFVTASAEMRAKRRFQELQERGLSATYDQVFSDLQDRDARDASRAQAPLKPAADAVVLDTSAQTIPQVLAQALQLAQQRFADLDPS